MYKGSTVAVVVPAFNEERHIARTVLSIPGFVDWVLVVDDASRDRTAQVLMSIDRQGLFVVRHPVNQGVGAAIFTGYRKSMELDADLVAVMAGDDQMDGADLPFLLDALVEGEAGYAKGNRFGHPDVWRVMPKPRIAGNVVLSLLTRVTSGYPDIFDSQCGYTAIRGEALKKLDLDQIFTRYGYLNDLLAHLKTAGIAVKDVTVRPVYNGSYSGIRFTTVLNPILGVMAWSFIRRQFLTLTCKVQRGGNRPSGDGEA